MSKPRELATGSAVELEFHGDKIKWERDIVADRVAIDKDGHLLFASIVTDAMQFKGIRGAVCTNKKVEIKAPELRVGVRGGPAYPPTVILKHPAGYTDSTHRLPFRKVHAFLLTKAVGFLPGATEAHLWKELMGSRYSTPLLREWMPWLMTELERRGLLVHARCFNCSCATLNLTTRSLDEVVSEGVRNGHITIPPRVA